MAYLKFLFTLSLICIIPSGCTPITKDGFSNDQLTETDPLYWKAEADTTLKDFKSSFRYGQKAPKNVIIFLGDGLSIETITAARYLKAELQGKLPGEELLYWDHFPSVSLLRTFSMNSMVADSGSTATSYMGGGKASLFVLGANGYINYGDCFAINETNQIVSLLKQARLEGKSAGFVTTTRVTHATVAATYAHISNRFWESEAPCGDDIAKQLIKDGNDFQVILGGGAGMMYGNASISTPMKKGSRKDGLNLIDAWKDEHQKRHHTHGVAFTRSQLQTLLKSKVDYVLGLFSHSHMNYDIKRSENEPTLTEMTEAAIEILSRNPDGYVLLVEGGNIDLAHHANKAKLALTDTLAFEKTVELGGKEAKETNTLVIVLSDHSHTFALVGYPFRTQSLLDVDKRRKSLDDIPYLVASYHNGPGAEINKSRRNPLDADTMADDYVQQSLVPLDYATHSAGDVALYATGPFHDMFQRPTDNTYVYYAILFSLCMGPYKLEPHCPNGVTSVVFARSNAIWHVTIVYCIIYLIHL